MLKLYELSNHDRIFADEIVERNIPHESAPAFLLGRDVGSLCTTKERQMVDRFINHVGIDESAGFFQLCRAAKLSSADDEKTVLKRLEIFREGFTCCGTDIK